MKRNISYKILPEYNLIIEFSKGSVTATDLQNLKKEEILDSLYNPNFNFLCDFRKLESPINISSKDRLVELLYYFKSIGIKSKAAVLTTKPNQVVLAIIMKNLTTDIIEISTEPFSTLESALVFVDCSIDNLSIINDVLAELDKNTA